MEMKVEKMSKCKWRKSVAELSICHKERERERETEESESERRSQRSDPYLVLVTAVLAEA